MKTNFPSEYREHLLVCDPNTVSGFRADVMPFILDAIADFIAEDGHVFLPGIPQQSDNTPTLGEMSMNTKTGRPKNVILKIKCLKKLKLYASIHHVQ